MDRFEKGLTAGVIAFWLFFVTVDLAILGVVIWAIIKLVNHFA